MYRDRKCLQPKTWNGMSLAVRFQVLKTSETARLIVLKKIGLLDKVRIASEMLIYVEYSALHRSF